ncbi:MAG: hypothetical protein GY850_38420, partial [bacterium]|nr:hypothetical protein [bacterium]
MATIKEAREVADQFMADHSELSGRPVRMAETPASGYDCYDNWYLVPRGPRGGLSKKRISLNGGTPGATYLFIVDAGDIVLHERIVNGWKSYHSFVATPDMD